MKKTIAVVALLCISAVADAASAQLGGLKVPGVSGGGSSAASAGDVDAYVEQSAETAALMMASIVILDRARRNQLDVAELKAKVGSIQGKKDPKELSALRTTIESDAKALNDDANAAESIKATYQKSSAEAKALIAAATFNMAIAVPRAVKLAADGPALVKGMASNPANIAKVGKLKAAVELAAYEAGATAKFAGVLPQLLTAVKVEAPKDAQAAKPKPLPL